MKIKATILSLMVAFGLIFFGNSASAFSDPSCTPSQNPVNFCQNQNVWYTGVDFKLNPYGTHLYGTIHEDGRFYIDNCSAYNMYFSILSKNPSTSQTAPEQDNGQFGLCDYGLALSHSYGGTGEYFYQLYSGSSWGNRVAEAYAIISWDGSQWIAQSSTIEGVCGPVANTTLTTIPPSSSDACSSGSFINFDIGYDEYGTALKYVWLCEGSGGGSSTACSSADVETPVNGECGSADGQTISAEPAEYLRCDVGDSHGSIFRTLAGWTWSCYGLNGGTTASCSAIYEEAEAPPTLPPISDIPTPTECDSFSGIDKVLCNIGNTIQGIFLPSSDKITELQTAVNKVNNVFPFNYLRAIGSIFSNASTISSGGLTMTIMDNTATLNEGFYDLPIVDQIRSFFTFLIYLAFIWWAILYIKHFFK